MIKNKIYIDVRRIQTIRVEVSEEEGYNVPDDMIGFAEFYSEIKEDAYSLAKQTDWDNPETEDYDEIKVWIKK